MRERLFWFKIRIRCAVSNVLLRRVKMKKKLVTAEAGTSSFSKR
jgi:hypothetical protein